MDENKAVQLANFGNIAGAAAILRNMPLQATHDRAKVQACNMSEEEIAERDRPRSRQERRQMERLARKGRT